MFFILSKLLLFLLSPFFWFILCIGLYMFWKNKRWQRQLKWLTVAIFIFFGNTFIFLETCGLWEISGTKMKDVGTYDVAIVLGGMAEYNNDLGELSIRRTGDRIFQAITLYKSGKVKKIMISGDSGYISDRGLHEASQLKELLVKWGLPETDIITEEVSKNTHENAAESKKILDQSYPHFTKFLVVTSGMHMRRSLACFKKEGLECDGFSTDLYSSQSGNYYWDQYLIPNIANFATWTKLLKEMVGYVVYDVKGYI